MVIEEQPAIAIYFNTKNALVIRQRGKMDEDDPFIYVAENNIADFIDRLCDVVGIPSAGRRT